MMFVSDCLTDAIYLVVIWIFNMDFVIYDAHITHYHMDPYSQWPWVETTLQTPIILMFIA